MKSLSADDLNAVDSPSVKPPGAGFPSEDGASEVTKVGLRGRVLLVDDSRENQRILSYHLEKMGLKVVIAADGLEGVERGSSEQFDLILMDIQMPVIDGLAATELLRSLGHREPILALSALNVPGIVEKCLSAGCDGFLQKPIEFETLALELSRYFRIRPVDSHSQPLADKGLSSTDGPEETDVLDRVRERIANLRGRVLGLRTTIGLEDLKRQEELKKSAVANDPGQHPQRDQSEISQLTALINELQSILEETAALVPRQNA